MNEYIARPVKIKAVQWFKEGDHPEVSVFGVEYGSYVKCDSGDEAIEPGDWIVEFDNGPRQVFEDDDFRRMFQPADANPEPGLATRMIAEAMRYVVRKLSDKTNLRLSDEYGYRGVEIDAYVAKAFLKEQGIDV